MNQNDSPQPLFMDQQEINQISPRNETEDRSFVYKNPNFVNNLSQMNISHLTTNSQPVFSGQAPGMIVDETIAKIIFNYISNEMDQELLQYI